jgi:hypothetical protein
MKTSIQRELLAEHAKLRGLVRATRVFVGKTATQGFEKLNEQPAAKNPMVLGTDSYKRFFQGRRIIRTTELPSGPIDLPGQGLTATKISTELRRREHHGTFLPELILPAKNKLVIIELHRSEQAVPRFSPEVSISAKGSVTVAGSTNRTRPMAGEDKFASELTHGYRSPEELRDNYTESFSGALAVTGLVVACLRKAYGIESDTDSLGGLLKDWEQISPAAAEQALGSDTHPFFPAGRLES